MKPKQIVIALVMLLCAAAGIFALSRMEKPGSVDPDDAPSPENVTPMISVKTASLKRATLHRYVNTYGTVEPAPAMPNQPAAGGPLSSPTAGIVAHVNAVPGQQVKEGDVLVELNSSSVSHHFAKAEVERQKKLFADQNTSVKNLQDAESQLASLQIVSPISGTVTRISARAGAAVDANAVVAEVIDLSRLAITVPVPASQATLLKTNQAVEIQTEPPVTTLLSYLSPTVDPNDGTVLGWAPLPSDTQLRPGQFVSLRVVTDAKTNCLAAPAESVVTDEDGKSTVVLVKGDEASTVPVTAGLRENGWVEIEGSDLKEGDTVVTVGAYGFPAKAKIRDQNAPETESTNAPEPKASSAHSAPEK